MAAKAEASGIKRGRNVARLRAAARWALAVAVWLMWARVIALGVATPQPSSATPAENARPAGHPSDHCRVERGPGVMKLYLEGTPEQMGRCHGALVRDELVNNEGVMWELFERYVPTFPLRLFITDLTRLRYAGLEQGYGWARRVEIGAMARAFQPDPYDVYMPTYSRMLMLNALYDVALSFEHSPLVGCSSVYVARSALLGRNFDFEIHDIFDTGKAVIVFAEQGKIPVLSVAWPGLVGAVTAMNQRGVGAVVHGARAAKPVEQGEPLLITVREALANGSTAQQVVDWLVARQPMVSHMVLVADAKPQSFVVERVPGRPAHVRTGAATLALTNHLEGPSAEDPANLRVRQHTSTLARRQRLDELLGELPEEPVASDIMRILRDNRAAGGRELAPGDRRAIDADIATHGVVMDLRRGQIWVSRGPHLRGGFEVVRFPPSKR